MKNKLTVVVALAALSSTAAFAGGVTKVANDDTQGRVYVGGNVDYTLLAHQDGNDVLSSKAKEHFNVGAHVGYKQPIAGKFFVAGEFGPHWSTLQLNATKTFEEKWGVDALAKAGYNVIDALAVEGIVGYRYSRFQNTTDSVNESGHALVVGAGAEYMVTSDIGLGANYKHNFWFTKPAEKLSNGSVGLVANYYF